MLWPLCSLAIISWEVSHSDLVPSRRGWGWATASCLREPILRSQENNTQEHTTRPYLQHMELTHTPRQALPLFWDKCTTTRCDNNRNFTQDFSIMTAIAIRYDAMRCFNIPTDLITSSTHCSMSSSHWIHTHRLHLRTNLLVNRLVQLTSPLERSENLVFRYASKNTHTSESSLSSSSSSSAPKKPVTTLERLSPGSCSGLTLHRSKTNNPVLKAGSASCDYVGKHRLHHFMKWEPTQGVTVRNFVLLDSRPSYVEDNWPLYEWRRLQGRRRSPICSEVCCVDCANVRSTTPTVGVHETRLERIRRILQTKPSRCPIFSSRCSLRFVRTVHPCNEWNIQLISVDTLCLSQVSRKNTMDPLESLYWLDFRLTPLVK